MKLTPSARTRLLVVGKTGTGKSHAVKEAARGWLGAGLRVVALDPHDEYSRDARDTRLASPGPLRKRVTASELARAPQLLLEARLSLAVVPDDRTANAWARAFLLLERLLRLAKRPAVVILDEVGTWADGSFGQACAAARPALANLANTGRHDGLALCMVAQRAAMVPKPARAQASDVWAFRQDDPEDVDALGERIGPEAAARVATLPPFECVTWTDSERSTQPAAPTRSTTGRLKAV